MFSYIVLVLSFVAILDFILGILILLQDFRSKINALFSCICFFAALWCLGIIGFYSMKLQGDASSFWIISTHASASFVALMFFYFTISFPRPSIYKKYLYILPIIPSAIILYYLFFTNMIIGNVFDDRYEIGQGYIFYSFYILLYFFVGYLFLFLQYKKTENKSERIQIKYILFGAVISSILGSVTNLIFPFMGVFQYNWLGPIFNVFLVIFIAYAIFKHHLFNIKVIATELLTFAIWIILLVKVFSGSNIQEIIINIIIFSAVLLFGIFLIRSVINEVRQREEISKMAEDVRRAYVLEKQAKEGLEKLDAIKNQFLAQTQHDLRTPLGIIRNYCDLLLDGTLGRQTKKTLDVARRIQVVAENKIKDVNNFLDTTQFKLGKKVVSLTKGVVLNAILDEIIVDLNLQATSKGIYLEFEKPEKSLVISADREKLKASLFNIIDNAIKYTETGGVRIKVLSDSKLVKIIITDTGIGVAKEKIATLFETTFERSDDAKKASPTGRGIGLYLSSQIIKAHNGNVRVESDGRGKGSVFFIELPLE